VAHGFVLEQLVAAGIVIAEPGKPARDRFRNRVMIPIRDRRGRIMSFGGRAMAPTATAKYINGPQTPLFDEGKTLFNLAAARAALAAGHPLIVAEGYLDVISMVEAGIRATVAPLGTAVTADHFTLLLKAADECVFALDGDAAGLRAADRVIDTALPLLEAGKGIRFAMLPPGQDPDDMIRSGKADDPRRLITQSAPMLDLLWQRETAGPAIDSPERRAALEKRIDAAVARIKDPGIKQHYAAEVRKRLKRLMPQTNSTAVSAFARGQRSVKALARKPIARRDVTEAALLVWLAERPALIRQFQAELETLKTSSPDGHALRDLLLLKSTVGALTPSEDLEMEELCNALKQGNDVVAPSFGHAPSDLQDCFFAISAFFAIRTAVSFAR